MRDVDGVMGYQAPTVAPAYTHPSAAAAFPVIITDFPFAFIFSRRIGSGWS
jgi:hypothetical protein